MSYIQPNRWLAKPADLMVQHVGTVSALALQAHTTGPEQPLPVNGLALTPS